MGRFSKPRLVAMFASLILEALLAPAPICAVPSPGHSRSDIVSIADKSPTTESAVIYTPPLTRPPSLENVEAGATTVAAPWNLDEILAFQAQPILDFNTLAAPTKATNSDPSPWLPGIVGAIMVVVNFLLAPLGVRVGRGCGRGNRPGPENSDADGRDDDHPPRQSLWGSVKDAAQNVLDKAGSSLQGVADCFGDMFDDAAGRRARLVHLAAKFNVFDLSPRHGHKRHDSRQLIEVDSTRLAANKDVSAGVQLVCQQAAAMFPEVGYNQGFNAACKAIFVSVGNNAAATLEIFTKWAVPVAWLLFNENAEGEYAAKTAVGYTRAVIKTHAAPVFGWLSRDKIVGRGNSDEMVESLLEHIFFETLTTFCSRLGLRNCVMNELLEETMKAGGHGPGVSLYVVFCLLCMAEREGAENVHELTMVKTPIMAAARKVRSFGDLQKQAPITLDKFIQGYRAAMVNTPLGEELSE